jgi:hypothetical protein
MSRAINHCPRVAKDECSSPHEFTLREWVPLSIGRGRRRRVVVCSSLSLSLFSPIRVKRDFKKKPRDGRHRRAARRTPKLESVGRRSSPHTDSHSSHALRGGRSTQPGSPQHPLPPLWRRRGPTPIAGASNPHPCITPHNVCALHGLPPRLPSPRLHLAAPARGKERTTACAAQDSLHAGGSRKFFGVPSGTASSSSLFSLARRAREAS